MADPIRSLTLDGLLEEHRRGFPSKPATVFEDEILTYTQFADRVQRFANALEDAGVGAGDRILWMGQNSSIVLAGLIAAGMLGAMFCPLNWRQTESEIAFVIDDLEAKVVIFDDYEIGEVLRKARALAKHKDALWLDYAGAGPGSYEGFLAAAAPEPRDRGVDPDRPVLLMYTAAFDGHPNGAMLSQTALLWQNIALFEIQQLSHETVYLNSGPLFHIGTMMSCMAVFHLGGTNVFLRRTSAQAVIETIDRYRCTVAFLVRKTQQEIAHINRDGRYDLKCLTSPTQFPEWDAMVTVKAGGSLFGFGQTEVAGPVIWQHYGFGKQIGPNGRVGPAAQVRILDEAGTELPVGAVGEIAVRGPTVMHGYWRRPELNAHRQRGGWHRTNDLGRREQDGSFTFVGPKTQMIKSGAENIYPAEVEGCLKRHPAVADCAVIGVPDPQWIQSVKAIVLLKSGESATPAELIDHCRRQIASYKKPRFVEFAEALPRTPLGTVDYRALDRAYGGGNYPGGYVINN